jgi:hypothetical protein
MRNPDTFFHAVHVLKLLDPRERHMAFYCAMYWSEEKLELAEANGRLPFDDEPRATVVQ